MSKAMSRLVRNCFERGRIPLLMGAPGVGKTAFANALGIEMGGTTVTVCFSHKDPVDVHGVTVVAAETVTVAGKQMKMVVSAPPDWVVEAANSTRPVVVLLDELTCVPPATMAPVLDVLTSRVCGGVYLDPSRVAMMACANPAEMAAGGWDLPPPMANRLTHLQYAVDPAEWAERFPSYWGNPPAIGFRTPDQSDAQWVARQEGLADAWTAARVKAATYITLRPDQLLLFPKSRTDQAKAWPSPRSWDFVSRTVALAASDELSAQDLADLVQGDIGAGPGAEFIHWMNKADLADIPALFDHPAAFSLPGGIDGQYHLAVGIPAHVQTLQRRVATAKPAVLKKGREAAYEAGLDLLSRFRAAGGPKEMAALAVRTLRTECKPHERYADTGLSQFKDILDQAGGLTWAKA